MKLAFQILLLCCAVLLCKSSLAQESGDSAAEPPQTESTDESRRFKPTRTLNSYFPFKVPQNRSMWRLRKKNLRNHLLTSLGLNPMPRKADLNAEVFGLIDMGQYTIEKVRFESFPGFYVTGNLYKPKNIDGPVPGVLCPHGHHRDGRFRNASEKEIDAQISKGAEKFRANACSPLQARCAHLAKMGCIVFHYDMIGYADSQQISYSVAHGFAKQREDFNAVDRYGFFSPMAELHNQSIMGLQTWNSIRSLDFLESLDQVDSERIGVTGASGGGTQTFILCAIDERPDVCFPAVMVGTAMQGGCTCENCCRLRVGSGNVEIAAMFAPKPMGLTAADDWTKEMETKGFPEIKALYAMFDKPDNVELTSRIEFEHNYNQVSREAMYRWFDQHLGLNGEVEESEITFLERERLTVWNNESSPKLTGIDCEIHVLKYWREAQHGAVEQRLGKTEFRDFLKVRYEELIGLTIDGFRLEQSGESNSGVEIAVKESIWSGDRENKLVTIHSRKAAGPSKGTVYFIGQNEGLKNELLENNFEVCELRPIDGFDENELVDNGRHAAGYTYGYNHTLLASKARMIVSYLRSLSPIGKEKRALVGFGTESPLALLAATQLSDRVAFLGIESDTPVDFADYAALEDGRFLPGALGFFGMDGFTIANSDMPVLTNGLLKDVGLAGRLYVDEENYLSVKPDRFQQKLLEQLEANLEPNSRSR